MCRSVPCFLFLTFWVLCCNVCTQLPASRFRVNIDHSRLSVVIFLRLSVSPFLVLWFSVVLHVAILEVKASLHVNGRSPQSTDPFGQSGWFTTPSFSITNPEKHRSTSFHESCQISGLVRLLLDPHKIIALEPTTGMNGNLLFTITPKERFSYRRQAGGLLQATQTHGHDSHSSACCIQTS